MRINFDFADLEAFLVLHDTGSFVAAARHLGHSQSGLTRRIRRLEEELGTPLFERTTRSVRPTLAAKRFRPRAQAMLDDARETLREMQDETARYRHQTSAIVTVAAVPSAIPRLLIPAAGLFASMAGTARLRVLDLLANEVAEMVLSGAADFGISSLTTQEPGIAFRTLLDDPVVLAVPRGHPLEVEGPVRWRELAGHRLILPVQGGGNRAQIDRALARERISLFWRYEVPRTATALEMVRAGLGVAPLPRSAVPLSGGGDFWLRELVEPEVTRRFGLVTRSQGSLPREAQRLHDLIAAARQGRHDQPTRSDRPA